MFKEDIKQKARRRAKEIISAHQGLQMDSGLDRELDRIIAHAQREIVAWR